RLNTQGLQPLVQSKGESVTQFGPSDSDGPGLLATAGTYASEFGKGVVRGAADLYGSALKFGGAAQTVAARDMQRYARRRLDAIGKIDRGEVFDPGDDP